MKEVKQERCGSVLLNNIQDPTKIIAGTFEGRNNLYKNQLWNREKNFFEQRSWNCQFLSPIYSPTILSVTLMIM